jgi:hypothetical protein
MKSSDNSEIDLSALKEWFWGRIKRGSPRELQARQALLWMLRDSPLDGGLRALLTEAIDPDGDSAVQLCLQRRRGRPQRINDYRIAVFVYRQRQSGQKYRLAVEEAMTEFKASRGKVTSAYRKWRPHIERDLKLFGRI